MTNARADNLTQIPGLLAQTLGYEALFTRLMAGQMLVTGNSRLARVLKSRYDQWRVGQGALQWQSPVIVSWAHWMDRLWEMASLHACPGAGRAVPGPRQLISLWESTLKTTSVKHSLLRPESLASQLQETRQLIGEWRLDLKDPSWFGGGNENHTAFQQWNRAFEQRCERDHWISPEDRLAPLADALKSGLLPPAATINLLGFDEFTPARAALLSALIENGNGLCLLRIEPRRERAVLWKYRDRKHELDQMARWVRHWFETQPDATIGVVVPDLQARRPEVERQLEEVLCPGHTGLRSKPWNISMGIPLAGVPMIETAFDILKLLDRRIDIQAIGRVLRSPWLRGGHSERNQRALLEKCLRDNYPRQLTLGELIWRAAENTTKDRDGRDLPAEEHTPRAWNSPVFSAILAKLQRFERESGAKRTATGWARGIDHLLSSLGWPLEEELAPSTADERGYHWQALQHWRDCLRELATLDATEQGLTRAAAIGKLQQICRDQVFQPKTPEVRIQVLGLYEVNGLRFDHLWVLGLHNDNWPASAKPNPFIPGRLQQAAGLPHSSPQRELEVARTITRRLLETAPDCVFSYPGQLDGEDVLPSPLLESAAIDTQSEPPAWQGQTWRGVVAMAEKPQTGPLRSPGPLVHPTAHGGSSILRHQALCPFRAFASNRLGAEGLETPADGISPALHGSLVHRVLELFWRETRTQAALLEMDEATLERTLRGHVETVTNEDRGLRLRPAFRHVEADRIHRHVMDFLALEKQRERFEAIAFEKQIQTGINGLPIKLVIDRVDRVAPDEEIIIDYKTGAEDPKKWFGERPDNPQLPLYAISADKTPAAVAFGIIRDDGCLFRGVARRDGLLPDLPPKETKASRYLVEAGQDLPATISAWRLVLERLVADFQAGHAAVDPKAGLNTCTNTWCELQSLCRVGELEQQRKIDEDSPQQGPAA